MRSPALAVLLLVVTPLAVIAQRPAVAIDSRSASARPEDVGMSSDRLLRVKAAMQRYVDRGEIAGAVTLVARHGRVVHFDAVGQRDVDARAPMTTDTIFRVASMTKPIVAVGLLTLYEQGEFQLNDPVTKWLPEFQNMKVVAQQSPGTAFTVVPATRPITIRHLLTHTSGLQSGGGLLAAQYDKIAPRMVPNDTTAAFVKRLATLPLNFEPGSKWEYGASGNGLAVAARLIEVIAKQPLDQFLNERVLRPLKMNDTYFYLPEEKLARFAALYQPGPDNRIQLLERPDRESPYFRERTYFSGTGGLATTAADYLRFQQMLLNGGELDGARILGRKTVELMTSNHTGDLFVVNRGSGYGFGLGVSVVTDVGATSQLGSLGTFGWGGATGTTTFVDPVEDLIGIMLIQLRPYAHLNIRNDFQTLAYQAVVNNAPGTRSSN